MITYLIKMSILNSKINYTAVEECKIFIRPIRDVIEIIGGKWKLPILTALSFKDHRFKELEKRISGITPKMLSKELKDLEMNNFVHREVSETSLVMVTYSLTEYGKSLDNLLVLMRDWGINHRKKMTSTYR